MFQEETVVFFKLTSEESFQKLLLSDGTDTGLLGWDLLRVVVERLEVVEGAGVLRKELTQEGGSASPRGRDQDISHIVILLAQKFVAQRDGGEI